MIYKPLATAIKTTNMSTENKMNWNPIPYRTPQGTLDREKWNERERMYLKHLADTYFQIDHRHLCYILLASCNLQRDLDNYHQNTEYKQRVIDKFTKVWGEKLALHFLWKYTSASSLIFNFDNNNLLLFIEKYSMANA